MGQLVDEDERRAAREGGVEIELAEHRAAVLDRARRQPLEPREERLRLGPAVGLDPADHHVDTRRVLGSRGLEHRISLPDAGGGAEEHLELSARLTRLFLSDVRQQGVGVRARIHAGVRHACSLADGDPRVSRGPDAPDCPRLGPSAPRVFAAR